MKILAIRFARLGDVLLLLPALASLKEKFPDSRLAFLTGHRCAPIAEMCPDIDEVISVDRVAMRDGPLWSAIAGMAKLVRLVRSRHFDLVIDFHSFRETNLLTFLSGAPLRMGMKRHGAAYWQFCFNQPPVNEDKTLHVSEMFQKVASSAPSIAPVQNSSSGRKRILLKVPKVIPDRHRLVLYIDAPVPDRIWPPERFAALADFAIEKLDASVVVIAGNTGTDLAARVCAASRNAKAISVRTDLQLSELAAAIASARLLISNDTGPMHIGPAVGVPTVGLFSVGYPEHFRPIGATDRYLQGNPIEKIEVRDVVANLVEMWSIADPGLRR